LRKPRNCSYQIAIVSGYTTMNLPLLTLLVAVLASCIVYDVECKSRSLTPGELSLFRDYRLKPSALVSNSTNQKADSKSKYEKWFTQKQNHFQEQNTNTFQQRYFINTKWKTGTKNVHFLYIEGEGTADPSRVSNEDLPHNKLAADKDVGATVYSLEHRFRGKSQPFKKTLTTNYESTLSVPQALADILNFINTTNQDLPADPKWVLFGANYGASLALWFRLAYPKWTLGVISDSSSIVPTDNFYGYEQFVEQVYANVSYECWHGIKFAAKAIRNEEQYENGVDRLNDELKIDPKIDERTVDYKSLQHVNRNLLKLFEVPVVYNKVNVGPFANCCGIEDTCKIMEQPLRIVRGIDKVYLLAKLQYINIHGSYDDYPGIDNSYESYTHYYKETDPFDPDQASDRSWLYQQCHEIGQFVTTDSGEGLFAATVPNDYFVGLCADAFYVSNYEYTAQNLSAGIKKTVNRLDTSPVYKGTNALIFNGATDPMSLLGVTNVVSTTSSVSTIKNVGNAAVLQEPHEKDNYPLRFARRTITNKVKRWLKGRKKRSTDDMSSENEIPEGYISPENAAKPEIDPTYFPTIKNKLGKLVTMATPEPKIKHLSSQMEQQVRSNAHQVTRGATTFLTQRKRYMQRRGVRPNQDKHKRKKRALETYYIYQDIDHFDPNYKLKFHQRYFKNSNYQRDKDAPRFLMVGGEYMLDYEYIDDDYQYYQWAKDFRAVLFALEHRFFGYSTPFENSSTPLLRFLTMEQALADTHVFINTMNAVDQDPAPRWILFGGGYAGNLVAAFRLKFPDLSLGAIASSAPMQARTDFYEYMQRIERNIKTYSGSGCVAQVRNYFAWSRTNLNLRFGRILVKAAYCLPNHWDENYIEEKDVQLFMAQLAFGVDEVIQLDPENHDIIRRFCLDITWFNAEWGARYQRRSRKLPHGGEQTVLSNKERRVKRKTHITNGATNSSLTAAGTAQKPDSRDDYYEGDSQYYDYDDTVPSRYSDSMSGEPEVICYCRRCRPPVIYNRHLTFLQNHYRDYYYEIYFEKYAYSDEARLWLWIACTQWGFAQSTNYGYNMYSSSLPINHMIDMCTDVFGKQFNRTTVESAVRRTNQMYGGQSNYKGKRVVFINHSEDPWTPLGISEDPWAPESMRIPAHPYYLHNATSMLVPGTGHIADMFREFRHDIHQLKNARRSIKKTMIRWVRKDKGLE
jgi:pimeloyl-ACP methyl ester carboxylesterase